MRSQNSIRHAEYSPSALAGFAPYAHWLPRIALASVFLFHGVDKFMGAGVAGFSEMMGLPILVGYLVAIAEVLGGIGILAGALIGGTITRLAALAMVPVLLGAVFMVHWGQWHFMATDTHPMGGMAFQVVLLLVALYFLVRGNDV
ncbi:MAG: DoxX family protein [Wenzhouxiangellaceae bacterium]